MKHFGLTEGIRLTAMRARIVSRACYSTSPSSLTPTISMLLRQPSNLDETVTANGHIKSLREFRKVAFIDISDGSSHDNLNIVLKTPKMSLSDLGLKIGQSIQVSGTWMKSKGSQANELVYDEANSAHKLKVVGDVLDLYPIQKKSLTLQYLRSLPVLRHRTSTLASVLRFRSLVESKLMEFFNKDEFTRVHPPVITSSDCEGAGEQFMVRLMVDENEDDKTLFFKLQSYLTVSTQLHLEVLAQSLNRVWTLTPCFRAENSNTNRHLSEFWMLEGEIFYVDELKQLTDFVERMLRFLVQGLRHNQTNTRGTLEDLEHSRFSNDKASEFDKRWSPILSSNSWPSITYKEAIDIINNVKNKGRLKGRLIWGDSIQTEHEKWLSGEFFKGPVFITDYPLQQKPFYMPKSKSFDEDRPTVACFDLILPEIGELVGGSLREHSYENLVEEMQHRDMNIEDMEWYLSTRQNGSAPHGGFGLGFDRLVLYLSAMENIKDVIPFPRSPGSCSC